MKSIEKNHLARYARAFKSAVTVAAAVLCVAVSAARAQDLANKGVISPHAKFRGLSYGEWAAEWWISLFSVPIVGGDHPFFSGGAFAESKGVVFLAAAAAGPAIDVTAPAGTAFFVPVVNTECSVLEPPPFHGDDEAALRACANGILDHTSGLSAAIDDVPVNHLDTYRVESPLFEFGPLPEDNIFGAPAGTTSLSVDAGVYLLLAPLPVGTHTVEVQGTFDDFSFSIDTTFIITVTGGGN